MAKTPVTDIRVLPAGQQQAHPQHPLHEFIEWLILGVIKPLAVDTSAKQESQYQRLLVAVAEDV